jgi:peptidase M42 family hydrolase
VLDARNLHGNDAPPWSRPGFRIRAGTGYVAGMTPNRKDRTIVKIDEAYLLRQLKELLSIPSPTGYTDQVVRYCTEELERLGMVPELTRRGAIRAVRQGSRRRGARAIVAHLDTLGAQVKLVKDNGRLELVPIGHWSARFAEGARVTLFTEHGSFRGTILPLKASGHTYNEDVDRLPVGWPYVELRVDAVTSSKQDTLALGIDVGDFVAIDPQPEFLDNGFINSRHLDDKAGVAIALAAIEALERGKATTPVDVHWLFTIAEEVGVGAASIVTPEIASMVTIDNGTTAPGQNSSEFGVTIAMADQSGPFDYHLTKKLTDLCRGENIPFQKDVFRYYRSDSASAIEAGHDVRTALVAFGIDASHGYERIHVHALTSVAELVAAYVTSPLEIERDVEEVTSGLEGFTEQPTEEAEQPDFPASHPPTKPTAD